MKHSGDVDGSATDPITEVELSAEELEVELSAEELQAIPSTPEVVLAQSCDAPPPAIKQETAAIAPNQHSWLSSVRELSATQLLGTVAVTVIASLIVSRFYQDPQSQVGAELSSSTWSPIPQRPAAIASEEAPEPADDADLSPTLFENPFDKTEVFQLPPGTSYEEARVIVADMLMRRARERLTR